MKILFGLLFTANLLPLLSSSASAATYGDSKCEVRLTFLDGRETTVDLIDPKFKKDRAKNQYQKGRYAYVYRAAGMVFTVLVVNLEERILKSHGHETDSGEVILGGSITAGSISTHQSTTNAYASGRQVALNLASPRVSSALTCDSPSQP